MDNSSVNLADYDIILINTSGGKDSEVMVHVVHQAAEAAGVTDRIVAVHADLGRVEWPGTRELTERQVARYGHRFEVVTRSDGADLLTLIERRGMWPSSSARYCTSDSKRAPIRKLMTALADEHRTRNGHDRPVRILNCMGLRAAESSARAKKVPFEYDAGASTKSTRHVWNWLPIFDLDDDQVWGVIRTEGLEYHYAYDLPGVSRLSCFAGDTEVVTRNGILPIKDLVGMADLVIPTLSPYGLSSRGGFKTVEVRSFGIQPIVEIELRRKRQRKVIRTTVDHRWFIKVRKGFGKNLKTEGWVSVERTTGTLQRGDRLANVKATKMSGSDRAATEVPFAVAQGFVFGDGSCSSSDRRPASIVFHGDKDKAMLPYFAAHTIRERKLGDGYTDDTALYAAGLPRLWKQPPSLEESRSFLLSWLAGYFAADGCVTDIGVSRISSANREHLQFVRSVAAVCGVGYGPIRTEVRLGKGKAPSELHTLTLDGLDLPTWFFKIEAHAERMQTRRDRSAKHPTRVVGAAEDWWRIHSITDTGEEEEVFCAVVPGAQAFALSDDMLTGNCVMCVLSGGEQLRAGIRHNPELADLYVAAEARMGHTFKHNQSIASVVAEVRAEGTPVTITRRELVPV